MCHCPHGKCSLLLRVTRRHNQKAHWEEEHFSRHKVGGAGTHFSSCPFLPHPLDSVRDMQFENMYVFSKKKISQTGSILADKEPEEPQNLVLLQRFHCWQNNEVGKTGAAKLSTQLSPEEPATCYTVKAARSIHPWPAYSGSIGK